MTGLRTGGEVLVAQLRNQGVDTIFCVPGESFLPVLDALHDAADITVVTCRNEGGAAVMADAYGKMTGRPGVCLVTRGPGAANATIGLHTARQDSTPMLLLVGQVRRGHRDREAFQEVDYRSMFAASTKWTAEVDSASRLPEYLSRAFHVALAGRPGPVVLALPEDMLADQVEVADLPLAAPVHAGPSASQLDAVRDLLEASLRPLVIVGGGDWSAAAADSVREFCERWQLPVGAAFRCQDYVDNDSSAYCGHIGLAIAPTLARRIRTADLILVIGARLGDCTTSGYTLLEAPRPLQRLIHVHPGAEELGSVYAPTLAINSGSVPFARALASLQPSAPAGWSEWSTESRLDYLEFSTPVPRAAGFDLAVALSTLCAELPPDAIVTNGAGNYTVWAHRYWRFRRYRTQLAPTSGAMGYSVPSAVAAKLRHPNRAVVSISGDGCFLMNGQELATAVAHRLGIAFVVVNNGMLGTIRMHQERNYPGRVTATDLVNPDFTAYARAFGAAGVLVERTEDFVPAVLDGVEGDRPTVIEVRVDPEVITPTLTITELRALAKATASG